MAGTHKGEFGEDQLDVGQRFRNPYEQSKFEAEQLVRASRRACPIQIFRPSIVVGERTTGWTAAFNVLYSPLKAFVGGHCRPCRRAAPHPVDVVPVDYVADAVFELAGDPVNGTSTYHLVAGPRATSVGRLIERAGRYFRRRPPRLVPPRLYQAVLHPVLIAISRGRRRRVLRRTETLFPYFSMRVRFDDRRARSRLEPAGIRVPRLESYFDRLLDFATSARWGKRPLSRAEARNR